jgi:hypothetical protein
MNLKIVERANQLLDEMRRREIISFSKISRALAERERIG